MINSKQISEQIETLRSLQSTIKAFEEIAASRMQKIRKEVLTNREFLDGLSKIYHQVRASFEKNFREQKLRSPRETNGKTLRVLISANAGLYGPIVKNTLNLFVKELKKGGTEDAVIIGRLGRTLFERLGLKNKYKYFALPDQVVGYDLLKPIVDYITPYATVIVYHGLFKNILNQPETATDVTGGVATTNDEITELEDWIFEPTLEEVVKYFETEIFTSLFVQSFHEAQLAKFASRMVTLDQAGERIKEAQKKANQERLRQRHLSLNHKLISGLSGMSLWGVR